MFTTFLEKNNIIISFILGIIGVIIGLVSDSQYVVFIRCTFIFLFLIILFQIINQNSLKEKIKKHEQKITKLNNTIDNVTLEVLNRFENSPTRNTKLHFEEIIQNIKITGYDVEVEFEYKGHCIHKDGEDSIYSEIYGDSSIKFNDLNFRYFDIINNPNKQLSVNQAQEFNKLFVVKMRFLQKLNNGESFHIKYYCKFVNCISYGDDYYTTHIKGGIKKFQLGMSFVNEQPECIEVFDGTNGGESIFMTQLHTENLSPPFEYTYKQERVPDARDYVFKFRRLI